MPQLRYRYATYPLPSAVTLSAPPANFSSLIQKYVSLRLQALLTSPHAFGSSHAIESAFTTAEWEKRVWRMGFTALVCVAEPVCDGDGYEQRTTSDGLGDLEGEWVGTATLLGPISKASYELPPEAGGPEIGSDEQETRWHMTGLYIAPDHRGSGLAKMIIGFAAAFAKDHTLSLYRSLPSAGRPKNIRLRLMTRPDNDVMISLCSALGFVNAGRANIVEIFKANGEEALMHLRIAELQISQEMMTMRLGVVMERLDSLDSE